MRRETIRPESHPSPCAASTASSRVLGTLYFARLGRHFPRHYFCEWCCAKRTRLCAALARCRLRAFVGAAVSPAMQLLEDDSESTSLVLWQTNDTESVHSNRHIPLAFQYYSVLRMKVPPSKRSVAMLAVEKTKKKHRKKKTGFLRAPENFMKTCLSTLDWGWLPLISSTSL